MRRGTTIKHKDDQELVLERKMVTHHDRMVWDLERCVGCQIGPQVCPKDALEYVPGEIQDGRLVREPSVDVDPDKCVLCGICAVMCPKNAISMTLNDEPHIPVLAHEAFPELIEATLFDKDAFDWSRKDFVIDNCPTNVISYDAEQETLVVDDAHCIRCRQCEVASDGAFQVTQPWEGRVELRREKCVDGCLACADICPTRALHIDEEGNLALADYYCIKCGACMQVCPIQPVVEEYEMVVDYQGVKRTRMRERITNLDDLPVFVERWRVKHVPTQSGAWITALIQLADDKAGMLEIDRKRALRRRDLLKALSGGRLLLED